MSLVERILGASAGTHVHAPIDLIVTDDWTTPALIEPLEAMGVTRSAVPIVLVRDHTRPSSEYANVREREKVERNEAIMNAFSERYEAQRIEGGIQHHILPELGYARAGSIILGNDSHTSTLGAYSLYAQAGQPMTIAAAMRSGHLPITVPETIGVEITGALQGGASARDAMLALLRRLGDEATGKVIEYTGDVSQLSMAERSILANIAPETGARSAIFSRDGSSDLESRITLELDRIEPLVAMSGSTSGAQRIGRGSQRIDQVFIGTCAGGTYEEISAFAEELSGNALVTRAIVAPASEAVRERLDEALIIDELRELGVELLEPGCGPCFGFGPGRLGEGEVGVSTGNRNAPGRMGRGSHVHLLSGRSAGIVARTGYLNATDTDTPSHDLSITYPTSGNVITIDGRVTTDDITPSYVPGVGSSSDTDRATLRSLLFRYADEDFAQRDLSGHVLVAPDGFGYGSNRASSVRALRDAGIAAVISPRVAPLYADGARDEGFAALTITDDAFYETIGPDSHVAVDIVRSHVRVDSEAYPLALSAFEKDVLSAGGITNHEVYS